MSAGPLGFDAIVKPGRVSGSEGRIRLLTRASDSRASSQISIHRNPIFLSPSHQLRSLLRTEDNKTPRNLGVVGVHGTSCSDSLVIVGGMAASRKPTNANAKARFSIERTRKKKYAREVGTQNKVKEKERKDNMNAWGAQALKAEKQGVRHFLCVNDIES
ncbi:hypothetical protein DL95DRAFT_384958 [Leptodontidium sp. 2 PMI_412]|nr:hypothetical protein DL95DRAFT_384958 [Leptodontidium sp. 2 PMI_412]